MRLVAATVLLAVAGCGAAPAAQHGSAEPVGADCGGGPLRTTSAPGTPDARAVRDRVEAFIGDYYRAWERVGQPGSTFEAWDAARSRLAATYLTDESAFALDEGALSRPANHDPEHEDISSVSVAGDRAWVRSRVSGSSEHFYSYVLTRIGTGWRIERTTMTLDPPTAPVLDPAAHAALLEGVSADTSLQGDPEPAPPRFEDPFASAATVERLGPITTTGVMTVHDFGWVTFDLAPLSQRVPAGTYPVVVAHRADGLNTALRVQFADRPSTRWVKAARVGSDNQVSVDAGNVALMDFTTMPRCRNEWVEQLNQDHLTATDGDVFSIAGGPDDAVMVQSGYGDGAYPMYWGVAEDGTITELLVDFLVG